MRPGGRDDRLDRLLFGAGDLDHAMTELGDQPFQIQRDQRLVLDDDHVGGDLARDLAAGLVDQPLQLGWLHVQSEGGVLRGELLDRNEQEGLPRGRSQNESRLRFAAASPGCATSLRGLAVQRDGVEDLQERPVQGDPDAARASEKMVGSTSIASSVETT